MLSRRTLFALPLLATPAAADESFPAFLARVTRIAQSQGVPTRISAAAFHNLTPDSRVIASDQVQPEFHLTWPEYRDRELAPRIAPARAAWLQYHSLLRTIGAVYGVDPRIILAIWGLESTFGANSGHFHLIRSLATLAWGGRRAAYFQKELIAALQILAHGYATPDMLLGGWAGAIGQPQFMPSTYLSSAVDFDGDGKRDIWHSLPDVFASIANYLSQKGWQRGQGWSQLLAPNTDPGGARTLTLADETYLLHPNFDVIKRYNHSDFYAITIGLLADEVA